MIKRVVVPSEVRGLYNIGKLLHSQFPKLRFTSYEKALKLTQETLQSLTEKQTKELQYTSQVILKANPNYTLPNTHMVFFQNNYPGLVQIVENLLNSNYHSSTKTAITGLD
jgi:hypothetical protein